MRQLLHTVAEDGEAGLPEVLDGHITVLEVGKVPDEGKRRGIVETIGVRLLEEKLQIGLVKSISVLLLVFFLILHTFLFEMGGE
jgi:hypothetical protein